MISLSNLEKKRSYFQFVLEKPKTQSQTNLNDLQILTITFYFELENSSIQELVFSDSSIDFYFKLSNFDVC